VYTSIKNGLGTFLFSSNAFLKSNHFTNDAGSVASLVGCACANKLLVDRQKNIIISKK
jgi:hypothetical protein